MSRKIWLLFMLVLASGFILCSLFITDAFAQGKGVGKISVIEGSPTIVRNGKTLVARINRKIFLNDKLKTPKGSRISVIFNDGSSLNLGEESEVVVNNFVYSKARRTRTSRFSMLKGRLRVMVSKLAEFRQSRYEMDTPTAIIGIRGSDFILSIEEEKNENAVMDTYKIASLDDSMPADYQLAQAGKIVTHALCLSGSGSIKSKAGGDPSELTQGMMGSVIMGELPVVGPISQSILKRLKQATSVKGSSTAPVSPKKTDEKDEGQDVSEPTDTPDILKSSIPYILPFLLGREVFYFQPEPPPITGVIIGAGFGPETPVKVEVGWQE